MSHVYSTRVRCSRMLLRPPAVSEGQESFPAHLSCGALKIEKAEGTTLSAQTQKRVMSRGFWGEEAMFRS